MGEFVVLPVVRRESAELAAQEERRVRLLRVNDAARERNRRRMVELAAKQEGEE